MSRRILRGRVLTFIEEPGGADDHASYSYIEDGAVTIAQGRIVAVGAYDPASVADAEIVDHRPHLIMPGLIDAHAHYVQMGVIASYSGALLDWLNRYTFIEEQKFSQQGHAEATASAFLDEMIRHGTTTPALYCSVHRQSADALFAEAERRNMLTVAGKVMMDRNAPEALCDTAQSAYDDTVDLIGRWHGRGRGHYAITPRFAITSSPAQMEAAQALAKRFPDCHIQTHLSENEDEIHLAKTLYPECADYTDIYGRYGLLGPKSLMGHAIHLSHREAAALAEAGAVAVFCPTSNLFLGSGLFDRERLRRSGVRIGVATDVGGGTSFSMLRTLDEGYKVLQLRGQRLSPIESFYMMTLGNARALGLADRIGALAVGHDADLVVLDAGATPVMAQRMRAIETLSEELFLLQTMGDDRSVAEVYIAGEARKSALAS